MSKLMFGVLMWCGALVGVGVAGYINADIAALRSAVDQCEANLPHNQQCEYVITARIKEDK